MPQSSSSVLGATSASSSAHSGFRQSCDRCHAQKLRCVRADGVEKNKSVCQRCRQQKVNCAYSANAPKGRPRPARTALRRCFAPDPPTYRSDLGTTPKAAGPVPAVAIAAAALTRRSDPATNGSTTSQSPSAGETAIDAERDHSEENPSSYQQTVSDIQQLQSWTFLPDNTGPDWNDLDVDLDQWLPKSPQATGAGQPISSTYISYGAPNTLDIFDCGFNGLTPSFAVIEESFGSGIHRNCSKSQTSAASSSSHSTDPSCHIAELTQFNLRLCALNRAVTAFILSGCQCPGPVIDMAALTMVMEWIPRSSNASGQENSPTMDDSKSDSVGIALREIFAASCELFRIVNNLMDESAPYSGSSAASQNLVVDQLIIACATLLLNILLVVLDIVQQDMKREVFTTSLADLRLMLATQIFSYFIDRQNFAVDRYFSRRPTRISAPDSKTHAPREELAKLRNDVQQRFARLNCSGPGSGHSSFLTSRYESPVLSSDASLGV